MVERTSRDMIVTVLRGGEPEEARGMSRDHRPPFAIPGHRRIRAELPRLGEVGEVDRPARTVEAHESLPAPVAP